MSRTVWDDATAATALPPLSGNATADVCVIGLGGAGLSALTELAARGLQVIGLDAGEIGSGAAGRNGGFLLAGLADAFDENVASFGDDLAPRLYRHTLDEIQRMLAAHPAHTRLTGSLRIAATSDEIRECEAQLQALRAHDFPVERYTGPEGTGLLIPGDAVFHPQRCLLATAANLPANAKLFAHTPARDIGRSEVSTPSGRISCDTIIVAVDGRLECLLPELRPRVRTARLQMLSTAPARDVALPRPVYWRHGYEYWCQLPGGEIALGGFRDRGGEAEWTTEAAPGGVVQELLEEFLRARLKTAAPTLHRWAACVSYTADRLPILEQVRERVFAAGAYSGTGNITSRLGGRAAAQLACGAPSDWASLISSARERVAQARPSQAAGLDKNTPAR